MGSNLLTNNMLSVHFVMKKKSITSFVIDLQFSIFSVVFPFVYMYEEQ